MTVAKGREFLSIPGPTNVPDAVLAAMHRPAIDIYSGESDHLLRKLAVALDIAPPSGSASGVSDISIDFSLTLRPLP